MFDEMLNGTYPPSPLFVDEPAFDAKIVYTTNLPSEPMRSCALGFFPMRPAVYFLDKLQSTAKIAIQTKAYAVVLSAHCQCRIGNLLGRYSSPVILAVKTN